MSDHGYSYTFGVGWQKATPPAKPTPLQIVAQVAAEHGLMVTELKGPSRTRHVAWARQEAMARLRRETIWSLPKIGQYLGGRDHTTVLYGIRAHDARQADQQVAA